MADNALEIVEEIVEAEHRRRREEGLSPRPTGFWILSLPFYGPVVAILLYPIASAVMLATAYLLGQILVTLGVSSGSIPYWGWIGLAGVFIVAFRFDSRLGLTTPSSGI